MRNPFEVVIVTPGGREYDAANAPTYGELEDARRAGLDIALTLDMVGDPGSVIVRDRRTGEVEYTFAADLASAVREFARG